MLLSHGLQLLVCQEQTLDGGLVGVREAAEGVQLQKQGNSRL